MDIAEININKNGYTYHKVLFVIEIQIFMIFKRKTVIKFMKRNR
jgi:hypothetical protein